MKNRLFSILIILFIALTFTSNNIAQDLPDDPQQGDFPDSVKVLPEKSLPEKANVYDIKYSPDGTHLAVAGDFGIFFYDTRKIEKPVKITGNTGSAWNIAFCPDKNILASASPNATIRLLDTNTGQLLRTLKGRIHKEDKKLWIWGVSYSPDGNTIISRHNEVEDSTIRVWDVDTGKLLHTLTGHTKQIRHIVFSPDGRIIAAGSEDKTLCMWNVATGKLLHTLSGHMHYVNSVAFSPDGSTIASVSSDKTLRLWSVKTGQFLRTLKHKNERSFMSSVAYSPDGETIASYDGFVITLWDVHTGQILREFRERYNLSGVKCKLVFSPDGLTIASCGYNEVNLWDVNTGQRLRTLISR